MKCFFNSSDFIILKNNSIQYTRLNPDRNVMTNESSQYRIINNVQFPFKLQSNSLRISKNINFIIFLSVNGDCLVYDQNCNARPSIKPNDQDMFTTCEFSSDSILCGSQNGKIFCYSIYDYKLKYMIDSMFINDIKKNYLFENNNQQNNQNNFIDINEHRKLTTPGPRIDKIYLDPALLSMQFSSCPL